jgi:zinc protease
MFAGTKNTPKGEFDRRLEAAGAESNAATWTDWTYYYENVPRARLGLAVGLEADRMAHLRLDPKTVASEKEVVANERRFRVDDDVEGTASETLYATSFTRHPYRWPTIGWMKDIEGFTVQDCRRFHAAYYAPNNATIVIAGDVDEEEAVGLVQEGYGRMRPAHIPPERAVGEPPQRRERRRTIRQPTPTDKIAIGYRSPAMADAHFAVLGVIGEILFGGRSSRMWARLVRDEEIASEVRGSATPFRDPGLYDCWLSAREATRPTALLAAFDEEIARLRSEPVPGEELEKAKARLELAFLGGMETASGKAEQIGFYETVVGDASLVFARLDAQRAVTADDVLDTAARWLDPRSRSVLFVRPARRAGAR